ncbi:MAG: TldD/PmbA family protein [Elusimicrobia bacterium]|nr:TldD/PmbA family protein [Elusimicrobiota bacterium]
MMGWGTVLPAAQGLEVYVEESQRRTLRWEDQRLEESVNASEAGVGLRRMGRDPRFASLEARQPLTQDLTREETRQILSRVKDFGGRLSSLTKGDVFVSPAPLTHSPSLKTKLESFSRADRAARLDRRVRQVRLTGGELLKNIAGRTPEGRIFAEQRSYATFVVQVTAENGRRRQTGYEVVAVQGGWESLSRLDLSGLANRAARRALAKLIAPPAPVGEMAVVVASEAGGTLIHEAVGHSLEADAVLEGSSPHYANRVGRVVANEKISVLDDPTRPGQRGSFRYDDEGTPAQSTVLIEKGVLRTYLHDRRSAQRGECPSNGHGRRESFAHVPIPRMSNTFIASGPDDPQQILRELKRGLYVTRMGGGQVNTATGDFVFEVEEGFWVEDGKVRHPVRGANLLGNGPEVLRSIDRVGWDLGWSVGTCGKEGQGVPVSDGLPTLRIPRVVVGGSA